MAHHFGCYCSMDAVLQVVDCILEMITFVVAQFLNFFHGVFGLCVQDANKC